MVRAGRGRGAGNEGSGDEKTGFHSRASGTPAGTLGQISPRKYVSNKLLPSMFQTEESPTISHATAPFAKQETPSLPPTKT